MSRDGADELLLGEWACLGILYRAPGHGFAVAARLKPECDVGRIWSMSRALTYRSLDQLAARGLIEPIAEEPGIAGGQRTVLAITAAGRAALRRWLRTPVAHIRDLRSALLLKITLADLNRIDIGAMLEAQRTHISTLVDTFGAADPEDPDVVAMWRLESATAALRFLDRLADHRPS